MARVLFLGGLGRSGTTLLERILGELPGVAPLGEVVHLWQRGIRADERCGCGARFSACPFWQRVGEIAFGGWHTVDLARLAHLRLAVERTRHIPRLAGRSLPTAHQLLVTEYGEYYARVYAAASQVSGARLVVDSSKHASLAYCLRWTYGLDLRVVHVVRDARGVAYSWTKHVVRPESDTGEEMHRYAPARSALLWNAHNAAFGLLRRLGVPVLRVRYEQFLAEPVATVERIAEFAMLPPAPLDFLSAGHVDLGVQHTAAGNPLRFAVGRVPLRHDDAWRAQLPPRQRRLVSALTAPLLGAYGYRMAGRGKPAEPDEPAHTTAPGKPARTAAGRGKPAESDEPARTAAPGKPAHTTAPGKPARTAGRRAAADDGTGR